MIDTHNIKYNTLEHVEIILKTLHKSSNIRFVKLTELCEQALSVLAKIKTELKVKITPTEFLPFNISGGSEISNTSIWNMSVGDSFEYLFPSVFSHVVVFGLLNSVSFSDNDILLLVLDLFRVLAHSGRVRFFDRDAILKTICEASKFEITPTQLLHKMMERLLPILSLMFWFPYESFEKPQDEIKLEVYISYFCCAFSKLAALQHKEGRLLYQQEITQRLGSVAFTKRIQPIVLRQLMVFLLNRLKVTTTSFKSASQTNRGSMNMDTEVYLHVLLAIVTKFTQNLTKGETEAIYMTIKSSLKGQLGPNAAKYAFEIYFTLLLTGISNWNDIKNLDILDIIIRSMSVTNKIHYLEDELDSKSLVEDSEFYYYLVLQFFRKFFNLRRNVLIKLLFVKYNTKLLSKYTYFDGFCCQFKHSLLKYFRNDTEVPDNLFIYSTQESLLITLEQVAPTILASLIDLLLKIGNFLLGIKEHDLYISLQSFFQLFFVVVNYLVLNDQFLTLLLCTLERFFIERSKDVNFNEISKQLCLILNNSSGDEDHQYTSSDLSDKVLSNICSTKQIWSIRCLIYILRKQSKFISFDCMVQNIKVVAMIHLSLAIALKFDLEQLKLPSLLEMELQHLPTQSNESVRLNCASDKKITLLELFQIINTGIEEMVVNTVVLENIELVRLFEILSYIVLNHYSYKRGKYLKQASPHALDKVPFVVQIFLIIAFQNIKRTEIYMDYFFPTLDVILKRSTSLEMDVILNIVTKMCIFEVNLSDKQNFMLVKGVVAKVNDVRCKDAALLTEKSIALLQVWSKLFSATEEAKKGAVARIMLDSLKVLLIKLETDKSLPQIDSKIIIEINLILNSVFRADVLRFSKLLLDIIIFKDLVYCLETCCLISSISNCSLNISLHCLSQLSAFIDIIVEDALNKELYFSCLVNSFVKLTSSNLTVIQQYSYSSFVSLIICCFQHLESKQFTAHLKKYLSCLKLLSKLQHIPSRNLNKTVQKSKSILTDDRYLIIVLSTNLFKQTLFTKKIVNSAILVDNYCEILISLITSNLSDVYDEKLICSCLTALFTLIEDIYVISSESRCESDYFVIPDKMYTILSHIFPKVLFNQRSGVVKALTSCFISLIEVIEATKTDFVLNEFIVCFLSSVMLLESDRQSRTFITLNEEGWINVLAKVYNIITNSEEKLLLNEKLIKLTDCSKISKKLRERIKELKHSVSEKSKRY